MEISRKPHRFNRRIIAFALFVLLALSYVLVTLVVAPPERDPAQATQSAIVLLPHQATKAGAPAAVSTAAELMEPARHDYQR
jgi:uncharacterized PurR-regulated membrane protein YhhQ (DUF165 family)